MHLKSNRCDPEPFRVTSILACIKQILIQPDERYEANPIANDQFKKNPEMYKKQQNESNQKERWIDTDIEDENDFLANHLSGTDESDEQDFTSEESDFKDTAENHDFVVVNKNSLNG